MKKIAILIALIFFMENFAFAGIEAQCLNDKGKTSPCKLENKEGLLVMTYSSKSLEHLNKEIQGKKITRLTGGEYSRRRVAESIGGAVLLGPLALFALFSKKKIENFGVEFINQNGKPDSTLIQTKKKYSEAIKSMLQSISGKEVEYPPVENKKNKK